MIESQEKKRFIALIQIKIWAVVKKLSTIYPTILIKLELVSFRTVAAAKLVDHKRHKAKAF